MAEPTAPNSTRLPPYQSPRSIHMAGWSDSVIEKPPACRLIPLPRITSSQGNLTFVEGGNHVPFDVRRVYFLYDVPAGAERGGHAHKELQQLIIPLSGSFDVTLDDGRRRESYRMDRPFSGLYIAPGMWRELKNFTSGSVCLVLASAPYDEADYIRNYDDFLHGARRAA